MPTHQQQHMEIRRVIEIEDLGTEAGLKKFLEALLKTSGPMAEDEIERLHRWAHQAIVDHAMLELLMAGDVRLTWPEGNLSPRAEAIR